MMKQFLFACVVLLTGLYMNAQSVSYTIDAVGTDYFRLPSRLMPKQRAMPSACLRLAPPSSSLLCSGRGWASRRWVT